MFVTAEGAKDAEGETGEMKNGEGSPQYCHVMYKSILPSPRLS